MKKVIVPVLLLVTGFSVFSQSQDLYKRELPEIPKSSSADTSGSCKANDISTLKVDDKIHYIEISSIENIGLIQVAAISDFENLISEKNITTLYCLYSEGKNRLYAISDNAGFCLDIGYYKNLADIANGFNSGYENGKDFYESKNLNITKADVYYYYKANDFSSVEDCYDAWNNEFFFVPDEMKNHYDDQPKKKLSEVYYAAKEKGFSTYADFAEYLFYTKYGFKNKKDYLSAKETGFSDGGSYYYAIENGFDFGKDYYLASSVGIKNFESYQNWAQMICDIEKICKTKSFDKKYGSIYYFLQSLPKDDYSVNALSNTIKENIFQMDSNIIRALNMYLNNIERVDSYEYKISNKRYGERITLIDEIVSTESIMNFIENADVKPLGSYNAKTDIFKKKLQLDTGIKGNIKDIENIPLYTRKVAPASAGNSSAQ